MEEAVAGEQGLSVQEAGSGAGAGAEAEAEAEAVEIQKGRADDRSQITNHRSQFTVHRSQVTDQPGPMPRWVQHAASRSDESVSVIAPKVSVR
jgi:hypothetical protein